MENGQEKMFGRGNNKIVLKIKSIRDTRTSRKVGKWQVEYYLNEVAVNQTLAESTLHTGAGIPSR